MASNDEFRVGLKRASTILIMGDVAGRGRRSGAWFFLHMYTSDEEVVSPTPPLPRSTRL